MFTDLSFYFSMAFLILQHAKPEVIQKAVPILQEIYDLLKTVPGIKQ